MENKIISIDICPETNEEINENAGVMWEHNATSIVFNIDPAYVGDYKYYIEYRSLIGTKVRTEYLELSTETNTVKYDIPVTMTSLGGVECYFNIVKIDEDGQTVQVIKPRKFCLQFDYSPDTDNSIAKVNDFSVNALFEAIRLGTFKGDQGEKGDKGDKGNNGEGYNSLIRKGKNLFNEDELEIGGLTNKGIENNNATAFVRTPYIYLEAGEYVYSNYNKGYTNFRLCVYDLNKVFETTQAGAGSNTFTIDSPKYIRIHELGSINNKQLEVGTEPTIYEPYTEKVKLEYIPVDELNIPVTEDDFNSESENTLKNKTITNRFNGFLGVGKNLYDNTKVTDNTACSPSTNQVTGALSDTRAADGYLMSEWIRVTEGENYIFSTRDSTGEAYRVHIADDNNILVADFFTKGRGVAFQIPVGGKKVRFSNLKNTMQQTQFEKGSVVTTYEDYKKDIVRLENIPKLSIEHIPVEELDIPEMPQSNWFEGKTILFNGDSITEGTGLTPKTQAYPYLVCKELKANIINKAIGGSVLAEGGADDARRVPLIARYDTEVSDEVAKTVDLVYIAIGSNDWNYQYTPVGTMEDRVTTTFYGALHLLCQGLLSKYKGKPIVFATPIKRRYSEAHTSPTECLRNGKTLKEYGEIIKEVCDVYSIPVLDMYSECCLTPFINEQRNLYFQETSGGIHPNADGAKIMARRVVAGLKSIAG